MVDAFSGNLAQFKLIDLLRLLHTSHRTGHLELICDDSRTGDIYVINGQITHAIYEDYIGEEAVYMLFSWAEGIFKFHADEFSDEQTTSLPTEEIMLECITYASEWESIRYFIPSSKTILTLSSHSANEFSLRAEEWIVIQNIDGHQSVCEIAEATHLGELHASKIIVKLLELGLVEIAPEKTEEEELVISDVVPNETMIKVEKELIQAIGPMGPIVLDDSIEILGYKRRTFPRDMMPVIAEHLAEEIPNNERRLKFQETMLNIVQELMS